MDFKISIFLNVFFRRLLVSIALGLVIYFGGFLTGLLNIIETGTLGSIAAIISLFAAVSLDRGREGVPKVHVTSGNENISKKVNKKIPYERLFGSFLSYFAFIFILVNYFPLIYGTLCNFGPIFDVPFIFIAIIIMIIELAYNYYYFSRQ